MKSGPRIATAVAVGYVLGRSRRMKMAITVGGLLAGRRLKADPKELLQKGSNLLSSSPELSKLSSTVRGQLLEAAKTAATAAASNKIDALGASLTEQAAKVRESASQDTDADQQQAEQTETSDQEQTEPEQAQESPKGEGTKAPAAQPRSSESDTAERSSPEGGPSGESPQRPSRPRPPASERSKPKPPASPRRRAAGSASGGGSQQEGASSKRSPRPKRSGNDG